MTKPYKKSIKKNSRKKRSTVHRKRTRITRGGNASVVFPPSFSNADVAASPQSYLPYNNFSNDPNYSVVNASNTGPFLTGVSSSGGAKKRKSKKNRKSRKVRIIYGGDTINANISNGVNTLTNGTGFVVAPAINELTGIAGIMSGFSNTGSVYNSTPVTMVPIA